MARIERKLMAHFVDASMGGTTPDFFRLGKDLEEYNVDLNPDTETSKNILGETTFRHNGYEASSEASPYYADESDSLFAVLQDIVDDRKQGDDCKTSAIEVHLWDETATSGQYVAYKQDCYIVPSSYGGDTSGYQIPFTVTYVGKRTKGKFTLSTGTWTADA